MTKSNIYRAELSDGQTIRFQADLSEASAPILVEDCDGNWCHTQYQTADARHDAEEAALLVASEDAAPDDEIEVEALYCEQRIDCDAIGSASTVSAEDWYDAYGWHLTTEECGDVLLQTVTYHDARAASKDEAAKRRLLESLMADDLTEDEANGLAEKAIEVAEVADEVESLCDEIIAAAKAGDLPLLKSRLDELSDLESDHGSDPTASALRTELIDEECDVL
jgi:hypothetical protein